MDLLNLTQILGNLRRTAEKGYISLLHKKQIEELSLKYFGIKDSNNKYIGYMCPYSGKIYSKKSNLVLEHIIPVNSKGGTVLFNCIPTSKEVNGRSEKGAKHLISWWTTSKYWDNEAPTRLEKLVNYILEAYDLVFKEYSVEEIEESYQEVLETNDDLTISKRQNKKLQEQSQSNNIHSYLGFLLDCIKQLEKENINTTEINIKLKELEEKNIFKDIERYTLFQNILKQVIIKFTGNDTKSYLTYSIKFDIKKLMDYIPYNNEQEIYNEIHSRLTNIQELLSQNNLVIEEYFNSLNDIENINLLYKPINLISEEEKQKFLGSIKLGVDTKISECIELLNQGYVPNQTDKEKVFSDGTLVNYFWLNHKKKIKEKLNKEEKYKNGYDTAKTIIYNIENPFDKFEDFIELLNKGYIPKSLDKETKFSDGNIINAFWQSNKEKIKERLFNEEKYKKGYDTAKQIIYNLDVDKISEYIEIINQGYVPRRNDKNVKFSNGDLMNQFWGHYKEKIKERLFNEEKYKKGYEVAKEIILNLENPIDKITEYIELLNNGYIPKYEDRETIFSDGKILKKFWPSNKEKIKERLFNGEKYKKGYEVAKKIISKKETTFDKFVNYIELLNKGYIPKSVDESTKFSNGESINQFWASNKEKIKERLFNEEKYKKGYEVAKKIIINIETPFDKIADYIELLNKGYIPKSLDKETKFSDGNIINAFWQSNKEKIKERLFNEEKYKKGYEVAKKIISNTFFDKILDYIELLNQGYVPKSLDKRTKFSNGDLINYFWVSHNNKDKIIDKLFNDLKDNKLFNIARQTILNYLKVKTIEEYYELEEKKKQLKELKNMKQNLENVDKSLEISETISRKRA